eukprot:scaffold16603_cov50-Cylindrotheca_fusiformis.AAC.1
MQCLGQCGGSNVDILGRKGREFFQNSKLIGRLVDNEADLTHRLKHRFDDSPLNKLCYYQSYQSLDDATAQLLNLMEDDYA